jgi:hypothetical protein
MSYVIITERTKTVAPDLSAPIYYSRAFGCFSRRDQAQHYDSFEAAQPRVHTLRNSGVPFVHAIEVRS